MAVAHPLSSPVGSFTRQASDRGPAPDRAAFPTRGSRRWVGVQAGNSRTLRRSQRHDELSPGPGTYLGPTQIFAPLDLAGEPPAPPSWRRSRLARGCRSRRTRPPRPSAHPQRTAALQPAPSRPSLAHSGSVTRGRISTPLGTPRRSVGVADPLRASAKTRGDRGRRRFQAGAKTQGSRGPRPLRADGKTAPCVSGRTLYTEREQRRYPRYHTPR